MWTIVQRFNRFKWRVGGRYRTVAGTIFQWSSRVVGVCMVVFLVLFLLLIGFQEMSICIVCWMYRNVQWDNDFVELEAESKQGWAFEISSKANVDVQPACSYRIKMMQLYRICASLNRVREGCHLVKLKSCSFAYSFFFFFYLVFSRYIRIKINYFSMMLSPNN